MKKSREVVEGSEGEFTETAGIVRACTVLRRLPNDVLKVACARNGKRAEVFIGEKDFQPSPPKQSLVDDQGHGLKTYECEGCGEHTMVQFEWDDGGECAE